ncbi:MAG TPA: hypothetical protein PKG48_03325 [Bacteroidales bacterium]|nr:hypothetical protein [Bacteroidales bacterium]HPS63367.1 hypothetical protein [Bacteroidales bacterium]
MDTPAVRCLTSITSSYLPKARILAKSLKRFHPGWRFDVLLSDRLPEEVNLAEEPFDSVIYPEQIPLENRQTWIFRHALVELCTAMKGPGLEYILDTYQPRKVIYFDPDMVIFNALDELERLLDIHPVILTPHLTKPNTSLQAIIDHEICAMQHGIFNLGFFAVRNEGQGRDFARWWSHRLYHFCYDDKASGLFTDQKWCDHVPAFFDETYILRDPGYNVATWNINMRPLILTDQGILLADGRPLRFYHFTGFDSGAGHQSLSQYGGDNPILKEMWDWYARELDRNGQPDAEKYEWYYGKFRNGKVITPEMRQRYMQRPDLQQAFPDPYETTKERGGYYEWYTKYPDFS